MSIAYSADIKKAKEVLTKVLSEDPDTIKEREHFVFVDELATPESTYVYAAGSKMRISAGKMAYYRTV